MATFVLIHGAWHGAVAPRRRPSRPRSRPDRVGRPPGIWPRIAAGNPFQSPSAAGVSPRLPPAGPGD